MWNFPCRFKSCLPDHPTINNRKFIMDPITSIFSSLGMISPEIIKARDAARATGNPDMVFDWKKAAQIIKDHISKGFSFDAVAGLKGDFEWTGGTIYEFNIYKNEVNTDSYTYLASCHATPLLVIEDPDGEEIAVYDCWVPANETEYRSDTKWPEDALEILHGNV